MDCFRYSGSIQKPLTDKGLERFLKDWAKVFQEVPVAGSPGYAKCQAAGIDSSPFSLKPERAKP
jgi:hypothetical protein